VSRGEQSLGVELRFPRCGDAQRLRPTFAALLRWDPELAPGSADRLSDLDADGPEPWRDELWTLLVERCADGGPLGWSLFSAGGRRAVNVSCEPEGVAISITLPRPRNEVDRFRALVLGLPAAWPVALALAFDPDSPDEELVLQGLGQLRRPAPLLYVDHRIATRIGGLEHLRDAAFATEELDRGVLVRTRDSVGAPP
jgi:hypothetical protein